MNTNAIVVTDSKLALEAIQHQALIKYFKLGEAKLWNWASVTLRLWILLMANSWILTSYETMFTNVSPMIKLVTFVMGTMALLRKTSRSLGIGAFLLRYTYFYL